MACAISSIMPCADSPSVAGSVVDSAGRRVLEDDEVGFRGEPGRKREREEKDRERKEWGFVFCVGLFLSHAATQIRECPALSHCEGEADCGGMDV